MAAKQSHQKRHTESKFWPDVDERLKTEMLKRNPPAKEVARAGKIAALLFEEFPEAFCALDFETPFQLLAATILSAQCTDVRVNLTTPALFAAYGTPKLMAAAPEGALEEIVRPTGFFNAKAKSLRIMAAQVVEQFGGEVPREMEKLTTLRGAGRKTSNVLRMHAFGLPGISVDTHFTRIMQRLGLTKATDAEKIEFDAAALLPVDDWTHFADAIILHGRKTCVARKPKCGECRVSELCPSAFSFDQPTAPKKKKKKA